MSDRHNYLVRVDFFKPSGKWYDNEYHSVSSHRMSKVVEELRANGAISPDYFTVITNIGDWGFPVMISPEKAKDQS